MMLLASSERPLSVSGFTCNEIQVRRERGDTISLGSPALHAIADVGNAA